VTSRNAIAGLLALTAALVCAVTPARAVLPRSSERVVSYRIDAALDHPNRAVHGRESFTWRNLSGESVAELRLHLYLNAFKNERSTFMKESKGRHRGFRARDGGWGFIDLTSLKLASGTDLLAGATFVHPDDENAEDETVLSVPLPAPVPPGGEVALEAVFDSRLPRVFARTGYKGDFYLVGQWFPKLGVYEPAGFRGRASSGWNCHQFHASGEFYADFGSFDVRITVPSSFVVGATGAETEGPKSDGATTTYHFAETDIHDFAWTAEPRYLKVARTFRYAAERDPEEERRMARILGLDGGSIPPAGAANLAGVPEELRLGDVEVTVLAQPEHEGLVDRHFQAAFAGLKYFGYWYGRYPYRTLTVVDPAFGARGAGGMEYPTFITAGTGYFAPPGRQSPEGVTVHEFGHQFWYAMVANNEFEEAWLDEGFNTYSTGKVMEKAFGPNHEIVEIAGVPLVRMALLELPKDPDPSSRNPGPEGDPVTRFLGLRFTGASNDSLLNAFRDLPFVHFPGDVAVRDPLERRLRYLKGGPTKDELVRNAWEFLDEESYANNSYSKTALTLRTLEAILGPDMVIRVMRTYHERFRFRHPSTADFLRTASEVAGRDLSTYFEQTVHGSGVLDYAVASVTSERPKAGAGIFGPAGARKTVSIGDARSAPPSADGYRNEFVLRRLGDVRVPVTYRLAFASGRTETRVWDGNYRWLKVSEAAPEALVSVTIDPDDAIALDADFNNNARTVTADPWPALKWWTRLVSWGQSVLYFYSGMA